MRCSNVLAGASLLLIGATGACGDAAGTTTFTLDQASEVAQAVNDAITGGISQGVVFGTTATISETVPCTGGGSSLVKGTTDGGGNNNLTVTFSGCHTPHLVIDGSMTFVETQTGSGPTSTTEAGDLTISGAASGTCHITSTSFCGVAKQ